MKIRMVVFLILAFLWSTDLFSEFSKQEAIDLVLKNLLVSDVGKVNIYVKDSPMTQPAVLIQNKGADIILPYTVNWIFFIDDNPDLLWKHNCRYCFVSASNGDYDIQAGDFYPSNVYNDFYCISTFEHPTLPQCLLPPPIIPDPYFPETNSHLWAVLICGDELNNDIAGWADDEAFWNTASGFYCALRENGFMESNIIVHYGEGTGRQWHACFQVGEAGWPQGVRAI